MYVIDAWMSQLLMFLVVDLLTCLMEVHFVLLSHFPTVKKIKYSKIIKRLFGLLYFKS